MLLFAKNGIDGKTVAQTRCGPSLPLLLHAAQRARFLSHPGFVSLD